MYKGKFAERLDSYLKALNGKHLAWMYIYCTHYTLHTENNAQHYKPCEFQLINCFFCVFKFNEKQFHYWIQVTLSLFLMFCWILSYISRKLCCFFHLNGYQFWLSLAISIVKRWILYQAIKTLISVQQKSHLISEFMWDSTVRQERQKNEKSS